MRAEVACVCLVSLAALGCGHARLDRANVGGTVEAEVPVEEVPVRGASVVVARFVAPPIEGELLAVEDRCVYVLDGAGRQMRIRRAEIDKISVDIREGSAGWYALWSSLGTASTLSHGFLAIVSGPVWVVTGIATTATEGALSADVAVRDDEGYALLPNFARYPQGMPTPGARPTGAISVPEPYRRGSETETETETDSESESESDSEAETETETDSESESESESETESESDTESESETETESESDTETASESGTETGPR